MRIDRIRLASVLLVGVGLGMVAAPAAPAGAQATRLSAAVAARPLPLGDATKPATAERDPAPVAVQKGALPVRNVPIGPAPAGGNQPPVAFDDNYRARPGVPRSIPAPGMLRNDTDPDGDPIVATLIVDGIDHGVLTAFPAGNFTYTSNAGYVGPDQFVYRMTDGRGGYDDGLVTINVRNQAPVANDNSYPARPGIPKVVAAPGFLTNDSDPDGDPVIATLIVDGVDHGSLTAFPEGNFIYTSNPGYVGPDRFTYRISDGFGGSDDAVVTINVRNQAPVANDNSYPARPGIPKVVAAPGFLTNDSDPDGDPVIATLIVDGVDHGSLTAFPEGNFIYTSNPGYVGPDRFTYRISDGFGGSDDAIVTINVRNRPPVAVDDSYPAQSGVAKVVAAPGFLANDSDPNGDPVLATQIVSGVSHGSLTAFPEGNFTYTSNPGYVGPDQFTYRISDGFGGSDDAVVTIDVT